MRRLRLLIAAVTGRELPNAAASRSMEGAALLLLAVMLLAVLALWGDPQPFVYEGF